MARRALRPLRALAAPLPVALLAAFTQAAPPPYAPALWQDLAWRAIGPSRGGRVTTVTGVANRPNVYYMGATGGGVWKTTDGGLTWRPMSDGTFGTGSVGAVAVAPSNPDVVYAGMGEVCARSDASYGDGVYRSDDAGRTWRHIGLEDSRHIGQIRVDPKNPDLVYVAVLGHLFGPNHERGVFRSRDGGRSWQQVLFIDENTGAVDLSMDPANPSVLYAAMWQVRRLPWGIDERGAGSGLYRTADGGDTWQRVTNGLPKGLEGRIGVSISPARPGRVWALIDAADGGVFRSDDGGATWQRTTNDFEVLRRPYYYAHIIADTQDPDLVYVMTSPFLKSADGGRTFRPVPVPHGDNHALWIAPEDHLRMINGNDGGAEVSTNGGLTWTTQNNQATAQFYHVITDDRFPYRIYGSQQDNTTVSIPHRTSGAGIDRTDWFPVGGGESGYIAPHPAEPDIVFGGSYYGHLSRFDEASGQARDISVWPVSPAGRVAADVKYRFQWTFPIFVSTHAPHALYAAANVLFRSADEGQSWQPVSPDLTRDDKTKQRNERLSDYYDTIFAAAESPLQKGLIWAGTDDGLVHLTRNDGGSWRAVTPAAMAPWTRVSIIEPSHFDPGTAYVAANRYQLDDFRPLIYRTTDYGRSWTLITAGIPDHEFVRVVREDPARRGLLFAGTETGVWMSFDEGGHWQSLQLNLPAVPVHDLAVKDGDLIAATHGRSFWILDDLSALEQATPETAAARLHLYRPRPTYRMRTGRRRLSSGAVGENPRSGVVVHYWLAAPAKEVALEFLDGQGALIRRFSSAAPDGAEVETYETAAFPGVREPRVTAKAGMNLFEWDMRYPAAHGIRTGTALFGGSLRGPLAVPGTYQVRLTADGRSAAQSFEIRKDPRLSTTSEDFRRQFDLLMKIGDKLSETHDAVNAILTLKDQLAAALAQAKARRARDVVRAGDRVAAALSGVLDELVELRFRGIDDQMLVFPLKLNVRLASIQGVVASAAARPTDQSYAAFESVSSEIDAQLARLKQVMAADVPAFNEVAAGRGLPTLRSTP